MWTDAQGDEQSAEIHWGYQENDTFNEFTDVASLDSNASTMSLNVIFDDYLYNGAVYEKGSTEYSLASDILTKVTGEGGATSWTMQAYVPTGDEGQTEVQTVTIENDADIYVSYVEKSSTYTPPTPSPNNVKGPITEKTVTPNPDGTYKVRLDITGQMDHTVNRIGANVIVIMDRTESMNYDMNGGGHRIDAAKLAMQRLISTLNPGTGEDQHLINLTVVEFANAVQNKIYYNGLNWTQTRTAMDNYASNLSTISDNPEGFGTCWQGGLYGGLVRAREIPNNDTLKDNKTYVIFVTDGNPNAWYTRPASDGGPSNNSTYDIPTVWEGGNFKQGAYDAAIPNAVNLSTLIGNNFYGIYCGNTTDAGYTYLNNLMNATNNGSSVNGTFIDGTSSTAIVSAFENIATTIVNDLGANEVVVDDGVPTLANVSAAVSGTAGGFEYFIKPEGGTEQPWTNAPSAGYSSSNGVTWDLSPAGVLADGTIYSLEFTVWPTQDAYDLLANLNNNIDGWRLNQLDDATREQLVVEIDGVKYGYTSGQDPNTGTWKPESGNSSYTTAQLLNQISNASFVTYNVLTNTHLSTTYKYGNDTYCDPPVGGINSEAMLLQDQTITVQKDWNNELDAREATETTLTITKDGANYIPVTMGAPIKTGDHKWTQSPTTELHISCGFMTVEGDNVTVKSSGHDYTVTEPIGLSWYWDLTADVYHPMVINGTNTMLIEVTDEQMEAQGFPADIKTLQNNKTKESGGKTYYKFGGNLYVAQSGSNKLHAYNDRRSRLLISKQVTGSDAPADAIFKFTVSMENTYAKHSTEEGYDSNTEGFWFVVVKDPDADLEKLNELPDAIARTTDGLVVTDAKVEAGNTGYYWFDNVQGGSSVTISIKAGWRIYFPNVGKGADYSVEELGGTNMPEGFVFDNVVPSADNYKEDEESTPGTVDAENDMKVNGSFDKSNTIYSAAYTNSYKGVFYVYHSSNCSVERFPMAVNGVARSTFNIFERTVDGTLYGGYFDDYAGKSASFDAKTLTYTGSPVPTATDAGGTAYSCAYIKTCDRAAWNSATAYTQSGKEMTPVKNTVYYLKEVPTDYLQPYTHYTYKKGDKSLQNMWYISANDDLRYDGAGFFVETFDADGKKTATIVTTLTVTNSNGGATVTLSPKSVFGKRTGVQAGYLTYWDAKSLMKKDQTSVFTPFWYTPDHIYVCGIKTRTINFNDVKVGSGSDCMRITDADNATPFPDLA